MTPPQCLDPILSLLNGSEFNPMQAIQLHSINSAHPHTAFPPPHISLNPHLSTNQPSPASLPFHPTQGGPASRRVAGKTWNAACQAVRSAWLGMKTRLPSRFDTHCSSSSAPRGGRDHHLYMYLSIYRTDGWIDLFLSASTSTISVAPKLAYLVITRMQAFGIEAPGGGGQIWNLGYV